MSRSNQITAVVALLMTALASHAVQGFDAKVKAPKPADMPISRNWRPGGVIGGRQVAKTRVGNPARPRGGPGSNKIDLNNCTLEQLQNLPGVGAAMGAHIMAGRPYHDFDDLARDGVPLNTIEQIRGLVTVGP